jgi:hypothetical protein
MFKTLIPLALVGLLINLAGVRPVYADSKEEKQARFAEKVKAGVLELGTGEAARVRVQLRDKTKLEGHISAADGEGFSVTNPMTGVVTQVAYPQVISVKGKNLSSGAKIAIGVGVGVGILIVVLLVFKERINGY